MNPSCLRASFTLSCLIIRTAKRKQTATHDEDEDDEEDFDLTDDLYKKFPPIVLKLIDERPGQRPCSYTLLNNHNGEANTDNVAEWQDKNITTDYDYYQHLQNDGVDSTISAEGELHYYLQY